MAPTGRARPDTPRIDGPRRGDPTVLLRTLCQPNPRKTRAARADGQIAGPGGGPSMRGGAQARLDSAQEGSGVVGWHLRYGC